ncbi:MAG TPA: sarcosine oxidase subunit gamma family protein [Roseiarcus sp.]|jgi:sarcosine oxidase subunit gamma
MADHVLLAPRSAFAGLLAPVGPTPAGVIVTEFVGLGLAAVEPRKGRAADLIAHVEARYGLSPPKSLRRVAAGSVAFLGVGPNRWLAVSENGAGFEDDLVAALDGAASVIAQTDGLAVLRISGSRVRDTFAKGLPIDLDPGAFAVGDVASSILAHIGVTIWRADEAAYDVAVPRSLAGDFSHWLAESAAEFGLACGGGEADSVGT